MNKEIPQTVNIECQKVVSFANVVGISPTILAVKNSELIFFLGAKLGKKCSLKQREFFKDVITVSANSAFTVQAMQFTER